MNESEQARLTVNKVARPDSWLLTMEEFMKGAQIDDANSFRFTEEELMELDEKLRENRARRDRDWSILNGQVVGAECF